MPTVSQTLFDFGANRGNLQFAKAQRDAGVANYEKAIQTAFREVADALALRGTIDEQLAAQNALTAASANALRLSTLRFEEGVDTYLNVLIAQRTLYAARQTLVASELAKATNLVSLYTALGGGPQRSARGARPLTGSPEGAPTACHPARASKRDAATAVIHFLPA